MSTSKVCQNQSSNQKSNNCFDFNLEDTDWAFNEMEESPVSTPIVKDVFDFNAAVRKADEELNAQVSSPESFDFLSEYIYLLANGMQSSKSLITIEESPSCEEISVNEDSSNFIPSVDTSKPLISCDKFTHDKLMKTLTDVKLKFQPPLAK
uniref:Uncharacterized protein n=1 Tax=Euplotes harpa TaxID=151035 RepID=A0A7S3N9B6_9SPIT|mmetsp:Transcript_26114/g.30154  ORF Transcript_26114/g.30154 Transcript_26114/m.30154 type:complete len:151 (+) Transcript_26114:16-468(+)|eukprot:CAMPEP_0168324052 /NCGR_PEP_ID=MMETSP0213-20121227/3851_1 /TAXON_ID=151035 /ORGANISM="Euplotes harpa, Strain FSP1.4" /LENGTH=150 /DNA_ID=CAMNT_0008326249 /DNA_START=14 /DNA_END=466 /DNA_ORIENTATION=+